MILGDGDVNAGLIRKIIDKGPCRKDVELLIVYAYAVFDVGSFRTLGLIACKVKVDDRAGINGGLVRVRKRLGTLVCAAGDGENVVCLHRYKKYRYAR